MEQRCTEVSRAFLPSPSDDGTVWRDGRDEGLGEGGEHGEDVLGPADAVVLAGVGAEEVRDAERVEALEELLRVREVDVLVLLAVRDEEAPGRAREAVRAREDGRARVGVGVRAGGPCSARCSRCRRPPSA